MSIRIIRGCCLLLLLGLVSAAASPPLVALAKEGELTIVRVFTGWHDAASFKRISEYFDGKENASGATLLRTQPEQRAGYYFLVRTANPGASVPVKVNLQLILPTEPKSLTHAFSTALPSGETVLNLGFTGTDWPDAKANPVAWKLDIVAADGRVLATEKSYLWDKPASN